MTKPVMLTEPAFCPHSLNKYASLMTTGNGYMGIRASHEEAYTLQTRGMYLAGLYHRAGKGEINELVNLPDVVGVEITLNGEIFSLTSGVIESWMPMPALVSQPVLMPRSPIMVVSIWMKHRLEYLVSIFCRAFTQPRTIATISRSPHIVTSTAQRSAASPRKNVGCYNTTPCRRKPGSASR